MSQFYCREDGCGNWINGMQVISLSALSSTADGVLVKRHWSTSSAKISLPFSFLHWTRQERKIWKLSQSRLWVLSGRIWSLHRSSGPMMQLWMSWQHFQRKRGLSLSLMSILILQKQNQLFQRCCSTSSTTKDRVQDVPDSLRLLYELHGESGAWKGKSVVWQTYWPV